MAAGSIDTAFSPPPPKCTAWWLLCIAGKEPELLRAIGLYGEMALCKVWGTMAMGEGGGCAGSPSERDVNEERRCCCCWLVW